MKLNEISNKEMFEDALEPTLLEMASVGEKYTGIENVVIWIGMDPKLHYLRVKVSNIPNKWSADNFTITIPELDVVGKINKSLISRQVLENIKSWIKLNIESIIAYEQGEITYTDVFLSKLVKI